MARVECPQCEMTVVVGPDGFCPDGHRVGRPGERIEQAIGDATPHPDEPEPWTAWIGEAPQAETPSPTDHEPREIRPISLGPELDDDYDSGVDHSDSLLRELHALTDLESRTAQEPGRPSAGDTGGLPAWADEELAAPTPRPSQRPSQAGTPPTGEVDEPWTAPVQPSPAWDPPAPDEGQPELVETWSGIIGEATVGPSSAPVEERPSASAEPVAVGQPSAPAEEQPPAAPEAAAPSPRRSEEAIDAIAELAALLDDAEGPGAGADAGAGEQLASVSHLPVPTPGGAAAGRGQGTPRQQASGDSFDWSHFTARGRRSRSGR